MINRNEHIARLEKFLSDHPERVAKGLCITYPALVREEHSIIPAVEDYGF